MKTIRKVLEEYEGHYNCDGDNWYGCPESESGCSDESQGTECNCGREERIETILSSIKLWMPTVEEIKRVVSLELYCPKNLLLPAEEPISIAIKKLIEEKLG